VIKAPGYDQLPLGKGRFVGVLQRFERRLGGLVEGAFAKVFKGEVQPVEVASALQREADDRKTVVGEGKVVAPNDYVVELGSHDHARLDPWAGPLGHELASMVREHAAEQGYTFVGPVAVRLEHNTGLDTGVFRIRSAVAAGETVDGGVITAAEPSPASDGASDGAAGQPPRGILPGHPRLLVAAGGKAAEGSPEARGEQQAFYLTHAVTVIGRAPECDLQLRDPGVSRRHAEIRVENDALVLVDVGSTNGVRVNDSPVVRTLLHAGDRIELGSTTLQLRRDED
jgi:Protein of unknown function (DUF3662)/Inner membrane component of T3SS, cytoplasmic domain